MTDIYTYKPTSDLTVDELSTIMTVMLVTLIQAIQGMPTRPGEPLQVDATAYANLPPEVLKHFVKDADGVAD